MKLNKSLNLSNTAVDKFGKFFNITGDCFNIFSNKIPVLKTDVKSLNIPFSFDSLSNNLSIKLSKAKLTQSGNLFFFPSIILIKSCSNSFNIFFDFPDDFSFFFFLFFSS